MGAARSAAAGLLGLAVGALGAAAGLPLLALLGGLVGVLGFGELLVHGLELFSSSVGLSGYASSVLVNGLAVAPELVLGYMLGARGVAAGQQWLVELAVLSNMVSAAANLAVLGLVVLSAGRGVVLPRESLEVEAPLLRATVAALGLLAFYAVLEACYAGGSAPRSPVEAAATMLAFYAAYLYLVVARGRGRGRGGISWAAWLAAGLAGLVASAELMSRGVEEAVAGMGLGAAGLLVGLVGTAPEAAVNMLAARRGSTTEAVAGLVAATSAAVLLVFSVLSVALPLPLDKYIAYMLAVLAAGLWLVNRGAETGGVIDEAEALLVTLLAGGALLMLLEV